MDYEERDFDMRLCQLMFLLFVNEVFLVDMYSFFVRNRQFVGEIYMDFNELYVMVYRVVYRDEDNVD